MKIAIVHNFHGSDTPSGENAVVDSEVAALRRAGHDIEVVAIRNDDMAAVPLHTAQGAFTVATGIGRSPAPRVRAFQPDVVHVHNLFPYFGDRWLGRVDAPVLVTAHNYRPMCANGYLFRDGNVCTLCPDGHRWSGTRYGCYRESRLATLPLSIATRRGVRGDRLFMTADRVIVLSARAREVYTRDGLPADRVTVAEHFVPEALRPPATPTAPAANAGDRRWVAVARLTAEKGVDRLVEQWPADMPLDVIGDGELRERIEALARGKAVSVLGSIPRTEVIAHMTASKGVVVASRWYEGFPLVYIEALAAGVPLVAFEPNVVADLVRRDGTGAVALWDDMSPALEAVDAGGEALRRHCAEVFEREFSEPVWLARRIALYEAVSAGRKPGQ